MLDLPAGEVTFLFTDVESSTALWERDPEAMAVAVADHDQLLRRAVTDNGGTVFKGLGDGVCAVFGSAGDAVAAALEGQRSLHTHAWETEKPLRVRMAVHTGTAQLRGGDYFGTALNRTARLMATAHGDQVVLSEATATQAEDQLPPGASLVDLGMHRLKDLGQPVRVFQLNHPELVHDYPPLRSLEFFRGNLPHRVTEFIGRETEIAALRDLLAANRLVTLAGTGGVGKTSLAIRTAAERVERFPDGVWLVELAPLTNATQIPGVVAGVLGVEALPSQDLTETLIRHLTALETLLIVDNCEHLIDGAARFTNNLLGATERVRILATSREPLRIDGEATFRVPSLQLPPADSVFDEYLDAEAVALFADRAGLACPGFTVDADNGPAVLDICRRLDGIPLAIELAAARLDAMEVTRLADRLDDRFRVLTRGSRAALPRHQTLEALVDWSHDLLTEPEQVLLRRFGVFGGSYTLEAAEQVCGFDPLEAEAIGDQLDRLVETSLVIPPEPPVSRYRTLETIRAYARQRLDAATETEESMRRLVTYLLEAGPPTELGQPQTELREWMQWRRDELDNFRAALDWARAAGDGALCGQLALELHRYLTECSLIEEADGWVESALELLPDTPTPLHLRLLGRLLVSASNFGSPSRVRTLSGMIRSDAAVLGDDVAVARALQHEAVLVADEGDLETAVTLNTEAAERLLAVGDPAFENTVVTGIEFLSGLGCYDEAEAMVDRLDAERANLHGEPVLDYRIRAFRGTVACYRGDYDRAAELFRSCVEPATEVGQLEHGAMLIQLGRVEFCRENYTAADELLGEGLSLLPEEISGAIWVTAVPALIALETDGLHTAAPGLRHALDIAAAPDYFVDREEVLTAICHAAVSADRPAAAAVIVGAAITARERCPGLVPIHWIRTTQQRAMEYLQQTTKPEDLQQLIAEGRSLSYEEADNRARTFLEQATNADTK